MDDTMHSPFALRVDRRRRLTRGLRLASLCLLSLILVTACGDDGEHGGAPPPPVLGGQRGVPVQVSLSCRTLTTDSGTERAGTAVKRETFGSLASNTALPTPGVLTACANPGWDQSVAPPKVTTYSYDGNGRVVALERKWGDGPQQPGIESSDMTQTFSLTTSTPEEQPCGKVLEKKATDANGHTTTTRTCTENDFNLSRSDAAGRTIYYHYDEAGLTTRVTNPNGSFVTFDYYYACPLGQDGVTPTCPSGSTAQADCPYGDQATPGNCFAQTEHAGVDPATGAANTSYRDGLLKVFVKDGMGRPIQMLDNRGAGSGDYTAMQTRRRMEFDDLGLLTSSTDQIGVSAPLAYRTTTTYGPKFRPIRTCDGRGVADEWVHDDVGQHRRMSINGHPLFRMSINDGQEVTGTEDCPVSSAATQAGTDCPTVSADDSTTSCSGDVYFTQIERDGSGTQRAITVSDPNAASVGASIESMTSSVVYSADQKKYGYSLSSTATANGQQVDSSASWQRDLLGNSLGNTVSVDAATSSTFSSSRAAFDGVGNQRGEQNELGAMLDQTFEYTPTNKIGQLTDAAGHTFHSYYDGMDRVIRHCYEADDGGSEGEILTRDAIDGLVTSVTHFTNPNACSACADGDCGDVPGSSVRFTYTPFGSIKSKTYHEKQADGTYVDTAMQWAYDEYQRPTCFADAAAILAGSHCPASPTPAGFSLAPEELLTYYTYWPDSDPYKRGFLKSACRGVQQKEGDSIVFVTQCLDRDYYTSTDSGGLCDGVQATGALAGLVKSKSLCSGGSCLDGAGSLIYATTYEYDSHRRACSVQSHNADDALIQGAHYTYDQYDNVITESHASDLDTSAGGNYEVAYQYDGMMR